MPESVKPNAPPLPRNPQFVHDRVKHRLDNLVPAVGAAPPINKQKFVTVIYQMRLQLLANERRHRNAVL
jgi:hypothetical protein